MILASLPPEIEWLLEIVGRVPQWVIYLLLGLGAAAESVFPPLPSDTFVLIGAFLVEQEMLDAGIVLACAWTGNVSAAFGVYALGRRYGRGVFTATPWGRWLLRPHQLARLAEFYDRYGLFTIFAVRFVPVFRAIDPVFAGISGLRFWKVAIPLATASALWYGILLLLGMVASRNLARLFSTFERLHAWLILGAVVLAVVIAIGWWRTRRARRDDDS